MKYIQNDIKILTEPNNFYSDSVKAYAREELQVYYAKYKEAHREYIEKGIYQMLPEMEGFRAEMEDIEKILTETQLKLF